MLISPRYLLAAALPALALLGASGCAGSGIEPVESAGLASSAIHLSAQLRGNGGVVQAIATLRDGDGYPITLTGGDVLLLSAPGGPEERLVEYQGSHYGQLESGATALELVLARVTGRVVSPIELPPAFALSGPPEPAPRSQPIPITWDAGDGADPMDFEVGGTCLPFWSRRTFSADAGGFEIQPEDLGTTAGVEGCSVIVEATRSTLGLPLAADLHPSSGASAEQVRALVIETVP